MDEEGSGWVGTYADVLNLLAGPLAELVAPRAARFAAPRHNVAASSRRRSPAPPLLYATCPGPPRRSSSMPPPAPGSFVFELCFPSLGPGLSLVFVGFELCFRAMPGFLSHLP